MLWRSNFVPMMLNGDSLRSCKIIDVNHFVPIGAKGKLTITPFLGTYDIPLPQSPALTRRCNRGRELFPNNRVDPNTPPPPTTLQRLQESGEQGV